MKALILSCNTGGGHNSAARAIAEEMQDRGDEAYVLDYLCLAGEGVSKLVGDGYVQIVKKTPRLFGAAYKLGMGVSKLAKKSPVYYLNGRMAKYLDQYLKEHPVDVLVMPHLYPAETITYMKRKGMKLPLTVAVMTDYYVMSHEALRKSCVKRGIPEEKLLPFGIPVSRACRKNTSRAEARKKLGLKQDEKYFLAAGGSMGAGDLDELIEGPGRADRRTSYKDRGRKNNRCLRKQSEGRTEAEEKIFRGRENGNPWVYHSDALIPESLRRALYKAGRPYIH